MMTNIDLSAFNGVISWQAQILSEPKQLNFSHPKVTIFPLIIGTSNKVNVEGLDKLRFLLYFEFAKRLANRLETNLFWK